MLLGDYIKYQTLSSSLQLVDNFNEADSIEIELDDNIKTRISIKKA